MKVAIVVALGLLVADASIVAVTGFLDRAVTIGAVTYRYFPDSQWVLPECTGSRIAGPLGLRLSRRSSFPCRFGFFTETPTSGCRWGSRAVWLPHSRRPEPTFSTGSTREPRMSARPGR